MVMVRMAFAIFELMTSRIPSAILSTVKPNSFPSSLTTE